MKNYTEDIIRYIDGLEVSKEFADALLRDKNLITQITHLKNDMFLMEKITDSKLEKLLYEKRASLIIKYIKNTLGKIKYIVEPNFGFIKLYEMPERNIQRDKTQSSYIYKNIETSIKNKQIYLKIKNIKYMCEIKKNKKPMIKTKSKNKIEIELENGEYEIIIDDYKAQIIVKPEE